MTTSISRSPTSTSDQFDIGAIMSAPAKDPRWLSTCLVMGLLSLIPVVGALNLSGWTKAIADRDDADTSLPEANLSYLGRGWRMLLAWLPLAALVSAGVVVSSVVALGAASQAVDNGVKEDGSWNALVTIAVMLVGAIMMSSVVLTIVGPAVNFLHIVDGERFASLAFKKQVAIMREGGVQYLLFFVAILVAGVVAQLGMFAFFVGVLVTVPYGQAMQGAAIAEFKRVLRPHSAGFAIDGSVGGRSGSPLGLKI
jgi:hypothetical protein